MIHRSLLAIETLSTGPTRKQMLPSMHEHMALQVRSKRESFLTDLTLIRLLTSVQSVMTFQNILSRKRASTDTATKRSDIVVNVLVILQHVLSIKRLPTELTHEHAGLVNCMDVRVILFRTTERLLAAFTLKDRIVPGLLVSIELDLGREFVAAFLTDVMIQLASSWSSTSHVQESFRFFRESLPAELTHTRFVRNTWTVEEA